MRPVTRWLLAFAAMSMILTMLPATAAAADPYTGDIATGCHGYNSGGRDATGRLYMPCTGSTIRIVEVNGAQWNAPISDYVGHVAPSPDGRYLYAVNSVRVERYEFIAGAYVRDGFTVEQPLGWAAKGWRVCGWGIATDGYGNIYVSNGGWCVGNPQRILKFRPDGSLVTQFGDSGNAAFTGDLPGLFRPNMMIAVTADGSRIWVADQNNLRVQFFNRHHDGSYRFGGMWSGEGTAWVGQLGAVYGVAVDPWGSAYVAQTTTRQIWRLSSNATNPVLVHSKALVGQAARPHTLAVDARGSVWVGEWAARFDRTGPAPGPMPTLPRETPANLLPPVLRSIKAPATTFTRAITVTLDATDDVAVTEMRLADETGAWGAWQPYHQTRAVSLTDGYATKVLYAQVRDVLGRESESRSTTSQLRPVPDVTAPTLAVDAPATTTSRSVTVMVSSFDAIGTTHLRIAGADGEFGPWLAWTMGARALTVELEPGHGIRSRSIQVRDASWNVSPTFSFVITVPAPVIAAPIPTPEVPVVTSQVASGDAAPADADQVAPRVKSLVVAARSCSRQIVLRIAARDDRLVTHVRVANEDGKFGGWKPLRSGRLSHVLSRGSTLKRVYVQVRDSAGNTSTVVSRPTRVIRC